MTAGAVTAFGLRPVLACALLVGYLIVWSGTAIAIPPNSRAVNSGIGWQCNTGYQRAGGTCRRTVITPSTTSSSTSPYTCPPGYQRAGGQCRKITVPENAYPSGVDWACGAGFFRSGGRCVRLDTPITVTSPPLVDSCDGGYVVVDGVCKMDVPERPRLD